jgi:hypothetical protein
MQPFENAWTTLSSGVAIKAVQQHLASRGYGSVTVFCVGACRNNVGGWSVREVASESTKRDFAYYATKDVAMAREAGCGLMLWDGKSKGTLHNILNLLGAGKKVLVYFSPEKAFYKLSTGEDLTALLARCNGREIARLQSSLAALPSRARSSAVPVALSRPSDGWTTGYRSRGC